MPCSSAYPSGDLRNVTRRWFFEQCRLGLGSIALASLLGNVRTFAALDAASASPLPPKKPHPAPKAKIVIYLFMAGGPSQLELFDYKPRLAEHNGQPIPQSFLEGKRFAFMDSSFKDRITLLGSRRTFKQHGQSGAFVSESIPHVASIVDDISIIR